MEIDRLPNRSTWIPLPASSPWSELFKAPLTQLSTLNSHPALIRSNTLEQDGHHWIAIKRVDLNLKRHPHNIQHEAKILSDLNHPNIVPLLGTSHSSPSFSIYMPLYTISLTDLLQSSIPELSPSFPAFHFISNHIFRQLTSGLSYLHGRGIAHRDIGPSNVLFDHHGSPIWIDFGTAWSSETSREAKGELEFELGTMPYRAPELLFGSRHYSPMAIDQWSLGVLLAEFFCPLIEDDDHTPIAHAQFPPPQFQEREAMFSFDGNDDGGVGEGSVLDWYSTPADQIWTRPSSDTWIDRSDDAKGSNEKCSLRRRKTLFVGHMGDIGLVGSIFKILGTPDLATWPEAKDLPDFSKLCFHTYSRQDLKEVLPYIELIQEPTQRDQLVDLISNLLVYSSHLRLKVDQVLLHPWLQQSLKDVYDGKTYKDWMKVWI